jgi:hypothetical protein
VSASARQLLAEQGIIAAWYLRPSQADIYELLLTQKNPFVECARRFGKTTTILCYVLEQLIRNPGWVARWCEPQKNQCREIVMPEIENLQKNLPKALRFKFKATDSYYGHANGSKLYLRGVNDDAGESARGSFAHIIVADEFGSWKDPDYIVNEALRPQLMTTDGQFIFASTPPRNLGHAYYVHRDRAEREGRFIQKTILDNETVDDEKRATLALEVGGEDTPAWKREYLCQRVADPKSLVVPEYATNYNQVVISDDAPRPAFFDCYVGGDSGADDNTAILFAYYDFLNDWLVIEDEYVASGKTRAEDFRHAKAIEARLWGEPCICKEQPCYEHAKRPYRRVMDDDKKGLIDTIVTHDYSVYLPEKQDKTAAIRNFRIRVGQGRIKIKERCKILRRQLEVGQWSNEKHLDFERNENDDTLKHLDALAAAIYLDRSIVRNRNPYPQNAGISIETHYIPEELLRSRGQHDEEALASLLNPFG